MNWKQKELLAAAIKEIRTPAEAGVLDSLIWHADKITAVSRPGHRTIAAEARITKDYAEKVLKSLIKRRMISIFKIGIGQGHTTEYLIHLHIGLALERGESVPPLDEEKEVLSTPFQENQKGVLSTSFDEDERRYSVRTKGGTEYGANFTKGGTECGPYKDEGFNNRNEGDIEGDVARATNTLTPPSDRNVKSRVEDPPAAAPRELSDERPFVEGAKDPRFESPHFKAVLQACSLDPDLISWKRKAIAAARSVQLAAKYSPQEIEEAGRRWPLPLAPSPDQLLDQIHSLLSRKEPNKPADGKGGNDGPRNEFQRIADERREYMRELGTRFGGG